MYCREFEVASLNFPGQVHRWRLSLLLQRGSERTREALLDDLAKSVTLVLVTGRARISSNQFSIKESLSCLLLGFTRFENICLNTECNLLPFVCNYFLYLTDC